MRKQNFKVHASKVGTIVNKLSNDNFKNFTQEDLLRKLSQMNCPFRQQIVPVLVQKGLIMKANKYYNFTNSSLIPDYIFEGAILEYQNIVLLDHIIKSARIGVKELKEEFKSIEGNSELINAIRLIKSLGGIIIFK